MPLGNGRVSKSGRNLDRNHGRGLLAPGAEVSVERHYLAFDGIVDRAYAQAARAAGSTTYSLITKVANTGTSGADNYICHMSVPGNTNGTGGNLSDISRRVISTGQRYSVAGLTSTSAANYGRISVTDAVAAVDTAATYMVGRDLAANTARGRVIGSDGMIRWTFADLVAALDSEPLDLVIGCATNHLFAPFAGTYFALGWVATLVLKIIPTDAQLQAYAQANDARRIWSAAEIEYYAVATGLTGSGPITPIVGSASLVLAGPTASDLVAL